MSVLPQNKIKVIGLLEVGGQAQLGSFTQATVDLGSSLDSTRIPHLVLSHSQQQ